jgi:phage head maturation protease
VLDDSPVSFPALRDDAMIETRQLTKIFRDKKRGE